MTCWRWLLRLLGLNFQEQAEREVRAAEEAAADGAVLRTLLNGSRDG